MAEVDAAAIEIIGRHLDHDLVAHAGANAELAHLAGHVGEHFVIVVELDPIISVRQHLGHDAFEFQQFFLRHKLLQIWYRCQCECRDCCGARAPPGRACGRCLCGRCLCCTNATEAMLPSLPLLCRGYRPRDGFCVDPLCFEPCGRCACCARRCCGCSPSRLRGSFECVRGRPDGALRCWGKCEG